MGRRSTYTDEIAATICERLSKGETLTSICRDLDIGVQTVGDWRAAHDAFAVSFARAREDGFDALAEDALAIADTPEMGVETTHKPDGTQEVREGDMLGHRKLRIETRLKLLAKWDPKRYGDKQQVEHSGGITVAASVHDEEL